MGEEIRRLSVTDLGGSDNTRKTLNESLVDTLEAFRQEELESAASKRQQQEDEKSKSWFGRKRPIERPQAVKNDMPELDARNVELSQISLTPTRKIVQKIPERLWTKKVALVAAFVAAVVLIWFGGLQVKAYIDGYLKPDAVKLVGVVENPAVALLNQPGRALDALSVAVQEMHGAPGNRNNQRVLDQSRDKVLKEVGALLDANPWSMAQLDKASSMLAKAVSIDPEGVALKDLKKMVDPEVYAYKMTIASVDPVGESATIRIVYPERPSDLVIKKKDEVVNGRFTVKRIGTRGVTFEDPKRKDAAGLPRTFSISLDGMISIQ